jgi:hypothetical protein
VHSRKNDPAKFLWASLGINVDSTIQIIARLPNGEQKRTAATIKGVQLQDGNLQLLAASEPIPENRNNTFGSRPLALTNDALEWVQPSPVTIAELSRQNPQSVKTLLPILWRYLQDSGEVTEDEPNFTQLEEKLADWPVQVIDLTNNSKPETVLTISTDAIATLKNSQPETPKNQKEKYRPRTLIVSDGGKVIYTDFQANRQQALTAIAKLSNEQSLALLVENQQNYQLQRWSAKNQRFE